MYKIYICIFFIIMHIFIVKYWLNFYSYQSYKWNESRKEVKWCPYEREFYFYFEWRTSRRDSQGGRESSVQAVKQKELCQGGGITHSFNFKLRKSYHCKCSILFCIVKLFIFHFTVIHLLSVLQIWGQKYFIFVIESTLHQRSPWISIHLL